MSALAGTIITATVVPTDSRDSFATHDEQYGKGGHRSVATIEERNNISIERRSIGMLVYVVEAEVTYQLVGSVSSPTWRLFVSGDSLNTLKNYVVKVVNGVAVLPTIPLGELAHNVVILFHDVTEDDLDINGNLLYNRDYLIDEHIGHMHVNGVLTLPEIFDGKFIQVSYVSR